jgi:hypothetical protein
VKELLLAKSDPCNKTLENHAIPQFKENSLFLWKEEAGDLEMIDSFYNPLLEIVAIMISTNKRSRS